MTMQGSKIQFCCSKFPWARDRIYPKVIENLGTRYHKQLSALPYIFFSKLGIYQIQIVCQFNILLQSIQDVNGHLLVTQMS
jgi:hypothetical protein